MAEVTYFVALPFIATDDGIAAGEATECLNPIAVVNLTSHPQFMPDDWFQIIVGYRVIFHGGLPCSR
jgi:hypothetical protein